MPGAREVLAWADQAGFSSLSILIRGQCFCHSQRLGLECYFTEILTSQSGFARKPNPEAATYLLDKYELDSEDLLYRGPDFGCGICPE